MINLEDKIKELISFKKEDDYWDFKSEHNGNTADLVHDIICLANNPRYKGDRYLIFGVDNLGNIVGLERVKNRLKQADFVDLLSKSNFANGSYPNISLETLKICDKEVDVLCIADKPNERPYYLDKTKFCDKERVYAGAIYSRVRDRNTPKDSVASTADIEKMWRQRFGLDLTPLERMTQYLLDFEGWVAPLENTEWNHLERPSELLSEKGFMYYTKAPEFTIKKSPLYGDDDSGLGDKVDCGESWVRTALETNSRMYKLELMYHQTVLHTEAALTYDVCELFNNPKTYFELKKIDAVFYYYLKDDMLIFNILQFLHYTLLDYSSEINNRRRGGALPLVIFKDKNELEEFCRYLDANFDMSSIENIEFYQDNGYNWEDNLRDVLNIKLCLFVKKQLPKWRKDHAN